MSRVGGGLAIVVPTYCEVDNVRPLLDLLRQALDGVVPEYRVIFVDDHSPDGTAAAVKRCVAEGFPAELVVRRTKRDLATAVMRGFDAAPDAEYLACMDADLSHPADALPAMLELLGSDQETDIVIGSRYVKGGRTEAGWGWLNRINSLAATALARPLTGVQDPMSGFFVMRGPVYRSAARLDPVGYKILLELLVKGDYRAVKEWPITFGKRAHGTSKLNLAERIKFLRHLRRLYLSRYGNWARYFQFGLIGFTGFCLDLLVFSLLLNSGIAVGTARAVAIWIALTSNFVLNRHFTFEDARRQPIAAQYALYLLCCLLGNTVSWAVSVGLILAQGTQPLLAAVIGIVLGSISNFLLVRHSAFRA